MPQNDYQWLVTVRVEATLNITVDAADRVNAKSLAAAAAKAIVRDLGHPDVRAHALTVTGPL